MGAYFLLKPFAGNYVLLYLFGSIAATFFEFVVAKLMIHIFGSVWWDYRDKPFNYEGILCLESSIAWGFYTVGLFAFLHRGVLRLTDVYSYKIGCIAGGLLMVYYLVDFTVHLCKAKSVGLPKPIRRIPEKMRSIGDNLRNYYR